MNLNALEAIKARIESGNNFLVHQVYEIAEHFGYETRNKYRILDSNKRELFFVAEQQKGILHFLFRQSFGHWRPFTLHFYDQNRELVFTAKHPFNLLFQRLEIYDRSDQLIGSFKQRFAIMRYRFDVCNSRGREVLQMKTKLRWFLIWTFPFFKNHKEVAVVSKKFIGVFAELTTDKDNFQVSFSNSPLDFEERMLILASAIFIDLMYFETKK